MDVLQQTAACRIVLEAKRAIEVRAVHEAMFDEHIPHPTRNLAANGDTAVSIAHLATADDDVLARASEATAVGIAAALDRDAVVAGIEEGVLDEHVPA